MSELVTLQLGSIFSSFKKEANKLQDDVLFAGANILRPAYIASVTSGSTRFFRTGAGLQSTKEEFDEQGHTRTYSLIPQAFYMIFGEYGTGRLGSQTGRPAPRGYRYGPKKGMRARRFGRGAIQASRPEVTKAAIELSRKFAAQMTSK